MGLQLDGSDPGCVQINWIAHNIFSQPHIFNHNPLFRHQFPGLRRKFCRMAPQIFQRVCFQFLYFCQSSDIRQARTMRLVSAWIYKLRVTIIIARPTVLIYSEQAFICKQIIFDCGACCYTRCFGEVCASHAFFHIHNVIQECHVFRGPCRTAAGEEINVIFYNIERIVINRRSSRRRAVVAVVLENLLSVSSRVVSRDIITVNRIPLASHQQKRAALIVMAVIILEC